MFKNLSVLAYAVIVLMPIVASGQDSMLVNRGARWSYHAAIDAPAFDWKGIEFDAKDWPLGKAGFGYGDGDDATVLGNMQGRFSRVQIRTEFVLNNLENVNRLYLYVDYDDGFVAYINGKEVTRRNVAEPSGGVAAGHHEVTAGSDGRRARENGPARGRFPYCELYCESRASDDYISAGARVVKSEGSSPFLRLHPDHGPIFVKLRPIDDPSRADE